jgi:3-oxoadipate enol-lactonase
VKLGYRSDGPEDAPPLVLSPALGTTPSVWDEQVRALADEYRIVRHELPEDAPVTIADIAAGVTEILDELNVERASFCGISLGGMVGMWLGANAPERIDRLVLACTGASLGTPQLYAERAALVRAEGTSALVEGARARWFTPAFARSPRAERVLAELAEIPAESYAASCEAVGAFDFHGELHRIVPPTLVISGEGDPMTPPETIETLLRSIPDARPLVIHEASHLANVEQPEAFSAGLLAHLQQRAVA